MCWIITGISDHHRNDSIAVRSLHPTPPHPTLTSTPPTLISCERSVSLTGPGVWLAGCRGLQTNCAVTILLKQEVVLERQKKRKRKKLSPIAGNVLLICSCLHGILNIITFCCAALNLRGCTYSMPLAVTSNNLSVIIQSRQLSKVPRCLPDKAYAMSIQLTPNTSIIL